MKNRNVQLEEASELLGITQAQVKWLTEQKIIMTTKGRKDWWPWPKIKEQYEAHLEIKEKQKRAEHNKRMAQKVVVDDDGTEWIKASEAAKRIGSPATKTVIGMYARQGLITRDEENKLYPWPKVRDDWYAAKETKNKKQESIGNSEITISDEEATNVITTEQIIHLIQEGEKGADAKAYQWARAMNEIIKVKQGQLKLKEQEGKTLDVEDVEKWVFDVSRQNKEFWMNWPEMVSVRMAEELGIDSRKLNAVLSKYVRKNLEKIATMPNGYEG